MCFYKVYFSVSLLVDEYGLGKNGGPEGSAASQTDSGTFAGKCIFNLLGLGR